MYHVFEARVREALRAFIQKRYGAELPIVTNQPPKIEMGEVASPVSFELAKRLKRAPRQIAQEIVAEIGAVEGVARWEVAGGGYVNAFLDRGAFFQTMLAPKDEAKAAGLKASATTNTTKTIVEHTAINPNKAAHIGHLRNSVLGDTFVRLLRAAGQRVEVQNYIDNTGVQVADVVIGFAHLEKKSLAEVRALAAAPRFDYYCWDLYARVTLWLEEDKSRNELRAATLKAIEHGEGAEAEMGDVIATAIIHCHLRTMERLGIEYDALPRESEILHLKFWDTAFALLKERGAIHLASSGKNTGCWVMRTDSTGDAKQAAEGDAASADDDEAKIIVRSNGTVTYVGKDIAYQLWKLGLLGKEFQWRKFHTHPSGHEVWITCSTGGDAAAPKFGHGEPVYTVIDSRQSYLQNVVAAGLRALGYGEQADHSFHFAYEMVALTPRCAQEMGYTIAPEDAKRPYVEVSGRKGQGVKADDLLDRLEASARAEVEARHATAPEDERTLIAHQIAIAALRFYLLKYTRNTVVAFDFADALSFDGETGPYCQYAVVRAKNIWRKHAQEMKAQPGEADPWRGAAGWSFDVPAGGEAGFLASPAGNDLWELVLRCGSLESVIQTSVSTQEPAFVAKYAFQLAQAFSGFYHSHHILTEPDAAKKQFLLALTMLVADRLITTLDLLGIEAPDKM